jgi:eukaryotic-like serine/threonine-protein kinase
LKGPGSCTTSSGHREPSDPGRRSLELRKLLRRFTDVCNAIDYAHSRGVLHRDIKPGNIIVGKHGETLVVDWGLAKAVGRVDPGTDTGERTLIPSSASESTETLPGSALGTPAYMSPEQAEGDLEHLGPRSDVYSLGGTLFYLLTGRSPIEGDLHDVIRAVQRGDIRPPRQLDPTIDRALEAVCKKAIAHRPADRYASPKARSDDIERWMADEPVTAWHEPFARSARRWANRNRTAVTGAAVALVAGVVGLSLVLAVQTQAKAAISAALGRETRAKLAAENPAVTEFRSSLADSHNRLGSLLTRTGRAKEAEAEHRAAVAISEKLAADNPTVTEFRERLAMSHSNLGVMLIKTGRAKEAETECRAALAIRAKLAAENPAVTEFRNSLAGSHYNLGNLLAETDRKKEAESEFRVALPFQENLAAENPAVTEFRSNLADSHNRLGKLLADTGRTKESESEFRVALAIQEKLAAEKPTVTEFRSNLADSHNRLGSLLAQTAREKESESEFRMALAFEEKLAADNPAVTEFRSNLADSHLKLGDVLARADRTKEAESEFHAAIAIQEKLAAANPAVIEFRVALSYSHNNLADAHRSLGRAAEAREGYNRAIDLKERRLREAPTNPRSRYDLAYSLRHRGLARRDLGDIAGAAADTRKALALCEGLPSRTGEEWFETACCHAALAGRGAPGLSSAEAAVEVEAAMDLLHKAVSMGYRVIGSFRTEAALEPLRDRAEFRLLMMDLVFPADAFDRDE